jgi:hypothetical protein
MFNLFKKHKIISEQTLIDIVKDRDRYREERDKKIDKIYCLKESVETIFKAKELAEKNLKNQIELVNEKYEEGYNNGFNDGSIQGKKLGIDIGFLEGYKIGFLSRDKTEYKHD